MKRDGNADAGKSITCYVAWKDFRLVCRKTLHSNPINTSGETAHARSDGIRIQEEYFPEVVRVLDEMDRLNSSMQPGDKTMLLSDFARGDADGPVSAGFCRGNARLNCYGR